MSGRQPTPAHVAVDDAILAALRDAAGFPLATSEIGARIGRPGPAVAQHLVYPRLARLARRGAVARTTVPGFRSVYWSATPQVAASDDEDGEASAGAD